MSKATIYHNPRCSNSRGALAHLEAAGFDIEIIDYLAQPPDAATLQGLLLSMQWPVRALLREKEAAYTELGLADATLGDAALIAAMVAHPILINRPIVVTAKGTRLCRPPEVVLEII